MFLSIWPPVEKALQRDNYKLKRDAFKNKFLLLKHGNLVQKCKQNSIIT